MTRPGRLLRAVLAEPAVPDPPPPARWDVALAVLMGLGVLLEGLLRPDVLWPFVSVPLGLAAAAGLAFRRARPLAILVALFSAFIVLDVARLVAGVAAESPYTMVFVLVFPYAVARWASGRAAAWGLGLVIVAAVLAVVVDRGPVGDAVGGFAVLAATAAIAVAVRTRGTARRRELEKVRSEERVDLARDLHDTVAHHVSAIAIRAEAGRAAAGVDADAALRALDDIQAEAGRALDEMRAMVRVLRTDDASYVPQPGGADLEQLGQGSSPRVEVHRGAGLESLPSAVDQALFRIAQESVTNARRHAVGARVVRIDIGRDGPGGTGDVRLEVADDGEATGPTGGGGQGLVGMAERASLLGGRLTAGPRAGGGWSVSAVIPVADEPATGERAPAAAIREDR